MKKLVMAAIVCALSLFLLKAHGANAPQEFFPMKVGTTWMYAGTVTWYDAETDKPVSEQVSWKMSVEKVIRKKEVVGAIVMGFPADLDWSGGTAEPKPWLILENEKHEVYYVDLGPGFDLTKFDGDGHVFDKFMVEDSLLFQWPLRKGDKFCDAEAKKREDGMYCWVAAAVGMKSLGTVKGVPGNRHEVYELEYRTNPDDTEMELVPGVGLLSYAYHHHGTVADTELHLVEFHPAVETSEVQGQKQ